MKKILIFFIFTSLLSTSLYAKNMVTLEKECNSKNYQSCADLARVYYNEKKDLKNTLKYTEIACQNNNPQGCTDLAGMYMLGVGADININRAIELSTKPCNDGFIDACGNLSYIYVTSPPEALGVKDYSKAKYYSEKACNGDNPYSCANLAQLYENGYGVMMDYDKSLSLYKKACTDGYSTACNNFKLLYDKVCLTNPKKYCSKYE